MANLTRRTLLSALGSDFTSYIQLPAVGASGGVLVAWRHRIGVTGANRVDANSISIQFCANDGTPGGSTAFMAPRELMIRFSFYKNSVRSVLPVRGHGYSQETLI